MKKRILSFIIISMLISSSSIFGQADTVHYKFFMQKKVQFLGSFDVEVFSGHFMEGTFFTVPEKSLATVDPDLAPFDAYYDMIEGASWGLEDGAIDNDITLRIYVRELDATTGAFATFGSGADTLFNYFEISVTEHVPGGDVIYGVDDDYYFKNDKAFTLDIPISGALTSFLQSVGLPINLAQLAFTYIVGPAASATFVGAGIETVLTNDTFGFRAIHLSKFGGGRGKLATGIEEKYFEIIPDDYLLAQNYPNPFNPTTTIKFSIPKQEQVSLSIYTATGELVEELISGQKAAGTYEVTFNAENLASGIYIYKLRTASTDLSKKMLLVK